MAVVLMDMLSTSSCLALVSSDTVFICTNTSSLLVFEGCEMFLSGRVPSSYMQGFQPVVLQSKK